MVPCAERLTLLKSSFLPPSSGCGISTHCQTMVPSSLQPTSWTWTLPTCQCAACSVHKLWFLLPVSVSLGHQPLGSRALSYSLFHQQLTEYLARNKWRINVCCSELICVWLNHCSWRSIPENEPLITTSNSAIISFCAQPCKHPRSKPGHLFCKGHLWKIIFSI